MIKRNKRALFVSSLVILLPTLAGLLLWNLLPDQFATHWGADGLADGWSSKAMALGMPLLILVVHWTCVLITAADPKNRNQTDKAFGMVLWICPLVSLFSGVQIYASAIGVEIGVTDSMPVFMGALFLLIGNYLPKCKHNYTLGIKVYWALRSEENWNATHRFGGRVWVTGGILLILCAFLPENAMVASTLVLLFAIALIPCIYSWLYDRRMLKEGRLEKKALLPQDKLSRGFSVGMMVFAGAVLVGVAVLLTTGEITVRYEDTQFVIEAGYYDDLSVEYALIDGIEYRETVDPGERVNGFGSPRLLMGGFRNDEFGAYTRYAYARNSACVVIMIDDKALVLNGKDAAATEGILRALQERIGK